MPATPRSTARQWGWVAVPLVGALLVLLFVALPTGSTPQSAVYDALGAGSVAAALIGIRIHRPAGRLPWLFIAVGQASFVVGDIIWTAFAALGDKPFPSPGDAAYLLGYPLIAIGFVIAIRRRITGGDRAGLLDAAILTTGIGIVWWAVVLGPLAAASDADPLSFAISVAYPAGDLLLIGVAMGLVFTPGARSVSFGLLVSSLVTLLLADLAFGLQTLDGTYVDGGTLDIAWLVAYLLFAMAALHPSMSEVVEPRPVPMTFLNRSRLTFLAAAMLVGPGLLVIGRTDSSGVTLVVAGATAVLSVLVLARLAGLVGHLARDVERRKELEEQLSFQAFHDPLTGLANRRRFMAAVGDVLARRGGAAVMFLDLDDFKHVNDDLGHDAGDATLAAVGHRLLASVRPGDLACRLGGDEFAVLLPDIDSDPQVEAVATRLLAALELPVLIGDTPVSARASLGIARRPPGDQVDVDALLRQADIAMYHAKARGKQGWARYEPALEGPAVGEGRAAIVRRSPAVA